MPPILVKSKRLTAWTLGILLLTVLIAFVATLFWLVSAAVRFGMQDPHIGVMILALVALFLMMLLGLARRERKAVEAFLSREQVADTHFLATLGLAPGTQDAQIALKARTVFSTLGCVPPSALNANDRFYPDLEKLPFYDSIDMLEILFKLERELGIKIPKRDADNVLKVIAGRDNSGTVGEATLETIKMYKHCLTLPCNLTQPATLPLSNL